MTTINAFGLATLLALTGLPALAADLATTTYREHVDGEGGISLPAEVRGRWVHLGSWVINDAEAPGAGFHDVYTQPEAARAYQESGEFADGTVLVKEIRSVEAGDKTTGPALWAGEPQIWFVMVKDSRGRFDGPHWGEGWGWALFKADAPEQNVSESFEGTCKGCHVPAQQTDWVFVEGYPTLR
ncbi:MULTISPECIES: cytochrome P460 family protein [Halomonas]|uniref:Cytochrome C n=2 Tax=Halomonas TaxID=2745 RepID=A0A7X4W0I7_9GAMM|nr:MULTISPECIES: cytochrome P460 family protein [Halomonas]MDR5900788.1 cytochrome P460 family protein [Halomonas icarae]NAW13744.1 cytochrome C [Halomonas icarae]TDB00430.1 cytochrome C [Halomonas marinisediminis]